MLRFPRAVTTALPLFVTFSSKSTELCAALALLGVSAIPIHAQTFSIIGNTGSFNGPMSHFGALIPGADGSLYGTTGASVFKITFAGQLTTLYRSPALGRPEGGLLQGTDGSFYGTSSSPATVFRITPAGQLTTLHNFERIDGQAPYGGVIQASDGNFYGTTSAGGPKNGGTVFRITPDGTLTTLHIFGSTLTDGSSPMAGLVQARDGNLYGTTSGGGANRMGTVFKITTTGTLTILHSFSDSDGRGPYAKLVQAADGSFYGTTGQGGVAPPKGFAGGTVFRITPDGALTTLYGFVNTSSLGGTDGYEPMAALVQAGDGSFYGTTNSGGIVNAGTVFRITPQGVLTTMHKFIAATEGNIPAGLFQGPDGNLYGTTSNRVFKLALTDTPPPAPSRKSGSATVSGKWTIQTRGGVDIWGKTVGANITPDTTTIELKQDGNTLSGTVTTYRTGARSVTDTKPISHAQLDGDNLSFDTVGVLFGTEMATHYTGKLDGDIIHFTIQAGGGRGRFPVIDAHRLAN